MPAEYLHTLQFKAAPGFSGMFQIEVQALTKDYGDDETPLDVPIEAISGEAWLQNILIEPRAGVVSADFDRRVTGPEGKSMALNIRPKTSDPEEDFDVTLSGIPNGAVIHYDSEALMVVDGSVTIEDFDPDVELTITPPEMDNNDFVLDVAITSKDILWLTDDKGKALDGFGSDFEPPTETDGGSYTWDEDAQAWYIEHTDADFSQTITIAPKGVADGAEVDFADGITWDENAGENGLATGYTTTEEDAEDNGIALGDLFTGVSLVDDDGSETVSYTLILPEGITLSEGRALGNGQWSLSESQLPSAKLITPENFKGTLEFTFRTVTTEDDGHSKTEDWPISLTVTPTPEATINRSATGDEDTYLELGFNIQHRNGDTDEELTAVWIDFTTIHSEITLYYDNDGEMVELTSGMDLSVLDGVEWDDSELKLTGDAIGNIHARGSENWHSDGSVTGFRVRYEITDYVTDEEGNPISGFDPVTDDFGPEDYEITIEPVTDQVTLGALDDIELTSAGTTSIQLTIGNEDEDYDGSEQLTRIILDDVPEGVVVVGTSEYSVDYIGGGSWVLIPTESAGNFDGELTLGIQLQVHGRAGGLDDHRISVTVVSEDASNGEESRASTELGLTTIFDGGEPDNPARIEQWEQTDFEPTEYTFFTLGEAIDAGIDADGVAESGFTVTLTDLPEGTVVTGMTETTLADGTKVWSASSTGDNAALQDLLDSITVTPPPNYNRNKNGEEEFEPFEYNATLTTHTPSGGRDQREITVDQEVIPVTDDATIAIEAPAVSEGEPVEIGITVDNKADAPTWELVDGKVYLQLDTTDVGAGTLTYGDQTLVLQADPDGLGDDHYVIEVGDDWQPGDTLELEFTPDNVHARGELGIEVTVTGTETDGGLKTTTNDTVAAIIDPKNDGYDFTVGTPDDDDNYIVTGEENAGGAGNAIALPVSGNGLVDAANESVHTVLLRGVPNDFLVYVDGEELSLDMATNAGSSDGTNTWLIDPDNLNYIAILPPQHWSGTVEGLELVVMSGEVQPPREDKVPFDLVVEPVADGITLDPNPSFGTEGQFIAFNLNADFIDARQASEDGSEHPDESTETATLQIEGLGEHTAFYIGDIGDIGDTLIGVEGDDYTVERGDDGIYTITGLSQSDLGNLGFVQAADDIADTLRVRGQTVESANEHESGWSDWADIETTINVQFATGTDDELLWTGSPIDARGGDDTIQMRFAEELTGEELNAQLDNIEAISMEGFGENKITALTAEDVLGMTDERNELTILGDDNDTVELSNEWAKGDTTDGVITYTYTGVHDDQTVTLKIEEALIE